MRETNSATCSICKNTIAQGALLCGNCGTLQGWRGKLIINLPIFSLIISILAISPTLFGIGKSIIFRNTFEPVITSHDLSTNGASIYVVNTGYVPGFLGNTLVCQTEPNDIGMSIGFRYFGVRGAALGPRGAKLLDFGDIDFFSELVSVEEIQPRTVFTSQFIGRPQTSEGVSKMLLEFAYSNSKSFGPVDPPIDSLEEFKEHLLAEEAESRISFPTSCVLTQKGTKVSESSLNHQSYSVLEPEGFRAFLSIDGRLNPRITSGGFTSSFSCEKTIFGVVRMNC